MGKNDDLEREALAEMKKYSEKVEKEQNQNPEWELDQEVVKKDRKKKDGKK